MKTVISLNEHEKTCNFIDQDPCFQNMKGTDWRRRVICYVGMFTIRDLLKRFIRNVSSFFFFLIIVVSPICLQIVGWPKHSFMFFHKMSQKNLNELFGKPNTIPKDMKPERQVKYISSQKDDAKVNLSPFYLYV